MDRPGAADREEVMPGSRTTGWSFRGGLKIVLAVAALFGLYRVFSPEVNVRAQHAYSLATGNAPGCTMNDIVSPLDRDLSRYWFHFGRLITKEGQQDGLELRTSPQGKFWTPPGTDRAFLLAEQELDLYRATGAETGIRKGGVVLDCGANIGTFTRKALEAGAASVIAIEISPRNVESLRRTFAKEIEAGRVTVVPLGVWHERSAMDLAVYDNSALDSLVMRERVEEGKAVRSVRVELTTIDQLVADLHLNTVDFIKMDIEGAERNALKGARRTIERFHPRLAVAAENLEDDVVVIPNILKKTWPGYRVQFGRCRITGPSTVRPEVMNFF